MRLQIKGKYRQTKKFGELAVGEVFMWGEQHWMKMVPCGKKNCVQLVGGNVSYLDLENTVYIPTYDDNNLELK